MSYEIIVTFPNRLPQPALVRQMRLLYDANGVDGMFFIDKAEGAMITGRFHRETEADIEYIEGRLKGKVIDEASISAAAIEQLVCEMTHFDPPPSVVAIIEALKSGLAVVNNAGELLLAVQKAA